MNALGLQLGWVALQVSVFLLAGIGLYAIARRRSPATGAWAAGAALAAAVALTAVAFSPWPRWWSFDAAPPATATPDETPPATETAETPSAPLAPGLMAGPIERRDRANSARTQEAPAAAPAPKPPWQAVLDRVRRESSRAATPSWQWPAWIAAAFAAGCFMALVRLAVAVALAQRYRKLARPLADATPLGVLKQVCGQIGCARAIELREAPGLGSPATMGWLRPTIILSADWASWSDEELRAVLAHEVAHITSGDFTTALFAQLGVALHFYNPLVHWLARRLRLEQEMAADVWGAVVLGSRQRYLATLANMALRRSDPPIAWAMRPFLPTRGTLMRRVEMLHSRKILPKVSLSGGLRVALAVVLLTAGCLVAGLRAPAAAEPIPAPGTDQRDRSLEIRRAKAASLVARAAAEKLEAAAQRNPGTFSDDQIERAKAEVERAERRVAQLTQKKVEAEGRPFNLDFVPNNAGLVVALRPAELAASNSLKPLGNALAAVGMFEPLGLPLAQIEECKLVLTGEILVPPGNQGQWSQPWPILMLRASKPFDWSKLATYLVGEVKEAVGAGQGYFEKAEPGRGEFTAYWLPDDQTIVLAPKEHITETFTLRGTVNGPAWADKWNAHVKGPAGLMLGAKMFSFLLNMAERQNPFAEDVSRDVGVLLMTGAQTGGEFRVWGLLDCRSVEAAENIERRLRAGLEGFKEQMAGGPPNGPTGAVLMAQIMTNLADETKIERNGATVRSQTILSAAVSKKFPQAVGQARAATRRRMSVNQLKQIAIALHNYHDQLHCFPPAVVMGPDGKTPHSWRVEILPYMEDAKLQAIYKQYRLNEPWDSEHNKKLIEATTFFSVPSDKPSEDCGYFFVTGPGTVFDKDAQPRQIRNITDGTSKTIGVVEARRSIPWTKPEDIEFDPNKPLPKLGGFFEGGFDAAFMDGSVHFLPDDIDEKTLRALVSCRGGEVINFDPQTNVPKVAD